MNPAAGLNPGIRERLDAVNGEIAQKKTTASLKWSGFELARDKLAKNPKDSTMLKAAEDAHLEFASVSNEIKQLEGVRDGIFGQIAGSRTTIAGSPEEFLAAGKSVGERAAESFELKELLRSGALHSDRAHFQTKLADISAVEMKALITGVSDGSAGAFVTPQRGAYVAQPQRPPGLLDLITIGQTSSDAIEYARQDTWSNTAAEVVEATDLTTGTKPEATMAFTKVTANVVTIAHWVRTTRRALADAGQLQMLIDQQLRYGLRLRIENQIINGDGTGENFTGILNTSGILSQAKGSDSVADAIHKGITQLRLGYVEPSAVLLHPNDYEVVRLSKDSNGQYLLGSPGELGAQTLWGIPVVVSNAVPDDTALVGDFGQVGLWTREDAQVLVSDSDGNQFTHNILTVLCEGRFANSLLLPAAMCKVTGVD